MTDNIKPSKVCQPFNRCKLFRICEHCARIRQAKLSDIAQIAARFSPKASYTVVMPKQPEKINELRQRIIRNIKKCGGGSMVTVESCKTEALHLNIIATTEDPVQDYDITRAISLANTEAGVFHENISPERIRVVTSYALKQAAIPRKVEFTGKTVSLQGSWRSIKQVMKSDQMKRHPLPYGIALQEALRHTDEQIPYPHPTNKDELKANLNALSERFAQRIYDKFSGEIF